MATRFLSYIVPFYRYFSFGKPAVLQFISPPNDLNAYALVTGASHGIGAAVAEELAVTYGFSLILHGRNHLKLEGIREKILEHLKVAGRGGERDIRIIVQDAEEAKINFEKTFVEPLKGLPITLLINNVGLTHTGAHPNPFLPLASRPASEVSALLDVNLDFTINLTRALIPLLSEQPRSHIVNISSAVALARPPCMGVYVATKAGLDAFTVSMSRELRMEPATANLTISSVTVSGVATNTPPSFFIRPPSDFAESLCRLIGDGLVMAPGNWRHSLQLHLSLALPTPLVAMGVEKLARQMVAVNEAKMSKGG